ncbi:phage tail fiber protein [Proteus vulgaris]|uniref:phage tail fiber protein n=1 Tax=Proteus vulgaris TaxID=585 RepID=UPI001867CFB5|nr:hypothetical protein [Proteus vulgaris]
MIYTTGTVNTVSGSAIVRGTGTKFKNNNPAINTGMTILIKSGNTNIPYMIKSVNSDTELVLAQPALATTTNTTFSIHITEPDNNSDAARTMVAINSYVEYFLDAMNTWMSQTGQTKIEMPNGEVVTLDGIKKMQGDIQNKLDIKKGGIQRVEGELYLATAVGVSSGTGGAGDNSAWFSLSRGEPDIYVKRLGKSNAIFNFPETNGGTLLSTYNNSAQVYASNDYCGLRLVKKSGNFALIETDPDSSGNIFNFVHRTNSGSNEAVIRVPKRSGTMSLVGDYGLGGAGESMPQKISCFYGSPSAGVPGFPSNGAGWQSTYSGNRRAMLFMDTSGNLLARFSLSNNVVDTETPWRTLWSSNNTTVDSNGFIKRASPIIDINPDGTFTTNDESEGAMVTRVAQGEYLIEGVLGFNSDAGWGGVDGGIEIPLDVNKQPLIWVNSKINKDGSILVKTYHRTHPNAPEFANNTIDGFNDGDPIDIPTGRFISVRVQMPEQSIYNVRMRELEDAQKAEEERRQKEEEMKERFGLGENDELL